MPLKGRTSASGEVIEVWGSQAIGLRIWGFIVKGIGYKEALDAIT